MSAIGSENGQDETQTLIFSKISAPYRALENIFEQHPDFIREKGDSANINVINRRKGRNYNVPLQFQEEFFTHIDQCRKDGVILNYLERQQPDSSGIVIDFDIYQEDHTRQITSRHFHKLTRAISRLFLEFLDFEQMRTYTFNVFFICKPSPQQESSGEYTGFYKDGFHMLIPEIMTNRGFKRYLISEIVKREICSKRVFEDLVRTNDRDKFIDRSSAHFPVMFLGSSKMKDGVSRPPYILTHSYNVTIDIDDEDCQVQEQRVSDLLSGSINDNGVLYNINLIYELSLSFNQLKSICGHATWLRKRHFNYKSRYDSEIQYRTEQARAEVQIADVDDLASDEMSVDILTCRDSHAKLVKNLLILLDIKYAAEYGLWFNVISAIYNINQAYKPIAIWFSQRVPNKYNAAEFERVWTEVGRYIATGRNTYHFGSLIYWARETNPTRVDTVLAQSYINLIKKFAIEGDGVITHTNVATILHNMLGDLFVTDKIGENYVFFEFVLPGSSMKTGEIYKWRCEGQNPETMHLFIGTKLAIAYQEVERYLIEEKDRAESETQIKYYASLIKTFRGSRRNLGSDAYQSSVIKQARYMFRDRNFFKHLDNYPDITGVGNGIIRIGKHVQFIKDLHNYRISRYTETNYRPYDPNNEYVKLLRQASRDIFVESDMSEFIWFWCSQTLINKTKNYILILHGAGANGKSFLLTMLAEMFGTTLAYKAPISFLTDEPERASGPNSAYANMEGKRHIYYSEGQKSAEMTTSRVKDMLSPENQTARELNQAQKNFKITGTQTVGTNHEFTISTSDHGIWRRILYYICKVKFSKSPDPTNPLEKMADPRYEHEYPYDIDMREALLSIIVHYAERLYQEFDGDIANVIAATPTLLRETEEYRNSQDTLNRFICEMLVLVPQQTENAANVGDDMPPVPSEMTVHDVATRYIDWFTTYISAKNIPNVRDSMSQVLNSSIAGKIRTKPNRIKVIPNLRIKSNPNEDLRPGEMPFIRAPAALSINNSNGVDENVMSSLIKVVQIKKKKINKVQQNTTNNRDYDLDEIERSENISRELVKTDGVTFYDNIVGRAQMNDPNDLSSTQTDLVDIIDSTDNE